MLRPVKDESWVKVEIQAVQGDGHDWVVAVATDDDRVITIGMTVSQVTYLIPAMKGLTDSFLFSTPYQMINRVAQAHGSHATCVVLDANLDRIVAGQIEMKNEDGSRYFLRMSAGDCIVFAKMHGLDIYMTEQIINYLTEQ